MILLFSYAINALRDLSGRLRCIAVTAADPSESDTEETTANPLELAYRKSGAGAVETRQETVAELCMQSSDIVSLAAWRKCQTYRAAAITSGARRADGKGHLLVATVTTTGIDTRTAHYQLEDSADGRFEINAATGEIFLASDFQLEPTQHTDHAITVRVTDATGKSCRDAFIIHLHDLLPGSENSVSFGKNSNQENSENWCVGQVVADPVTEGLIRHYRLLDDAGGRFTIDPVSGILYARVTGGGPGGTAGAYEITVEAIDCVGRRYCNAIQISSHDLRENNPGVMATDALYD